MKRTLYFTSLLIVLNSCSHEKKQSEQSEVMIFDDPKKISRRTKTQNDSQFSIVGKWRLDSIINTNKGIKENTQYPFVPTEWIFTNKNAIIVSRQQHQLDLILDEGKKALAGETPKQETRGRYTQKRNELVISLLPGKTYYILKKNDTTLQLRSQRIQISENDKDKFALQCFTLTNE
ncbi:hypothetical protein [Aquimarina sediminis]|uniref:hypothetical protein n=1 Tax=Aquimarina sediminis TaxID=2070536 RepID=UPI000CA0638A|nr:hypothetical protein [Aquimarina sediminis]